MSHPVDLFATKSWPFEEAKRLINRLQNKTPKKGYALFETGYGPSGLPHLGTFGEVARTSMVRKAFQELCDIPNELFCFSDDMDGLRKVPDNVPNQEMLRKHLGKPLTCVPDPFEKYESFGHHNNAMLCRFLDSFGFSYTFKSATQHYKSGEFDEVLKLVFENYDKIMSVMLPSLREERRQSYSPFLPICPKTGIVLQVPIIELKKDSYTIVYKDEETGKSIETSILGGNVKLQWKADWGARWRAFEVDYEMSGKDLIDSVKLSSQICTILGGRAPENLTCELFLDEKGQKISKSKGNGLTIDEWLTYAPPESLAYYMFLSPTRAKRLFFDVIPKSMDEYLSHRGKFPTQDPLHQHDNPTWHIHGGQVEPVDSSLSYSLLLNLASVCNADDPKILWGFVSRYEKGSTAQTHPYLDHLIGYAVRYYQDFIKPQKIYKEPDEVEQEALKDLLHELKAHTHAPVTSDTLQTVVFEVGKRHPFADLKQWFGSLYEILLGQKEGPRMGSFIALYGVDETIKLIEEKL